MKPNKSRLPRYAIGLGVLMLVATFAVGIVAIWTRDPYTREHLGDTGFAFGIAGAALIFGGLIAATEGL